MPELTFSISAEHDPNMGFNKVPQTIQNEANDFYGHLRKQYHCFDVSGKSTTIPSMNQCAIGDLHKANDTVLINGDSHAFSSWGMLDELLKNANLKGYVVTQSINSYLLGNYFLEPTYQSSPPNNALAKQILNHYYQYVVLAGWWGHGFSRAKGFTYHSFAKRMSNLIGIIEDRNETPVIILDFPPLLSVSKLCGFSRISSTHCYNKLYTILKTQRLTRNIMLNLKKKYKNIIYLDPSKIICDQSKCYSSLDGVPLYYNSQGNSHLNVSGSRLIGKLYLKKYGNPFL